MPSQVTVPPTRPRHNCSFKFPGNFGSGNHPEPLSLPKVSRSEGQDQKPGQVRGETVVLVWATASPSGVPRRSDWMQVVEGWPLSRGTPVTGCLRPAGPQLMGQGAPSGARQQPASSCRARSDIREKVLPQPLHGYFLVPECVCWCARRLERSAKALLQWGQA